MKSRTANRNIEEKEILTMAKNTKTAKTAVTAEDVAAAFAHAVSLAAQYNGSTAAPAPEPEDVDAVEDEEEGEEVEITREQVDEAAAQGIKELRALAKEAGIESTKKADILAAFDEMLGDEDEDEEEEEDEDEEDEDEEDEDEADEDEDEGEDEGEYTREDLEDLDLKELRKIAKEEGHSASDYRGLDQDALIDLILGEESDEDEDEDEDDEEEEEVELDEDALNEMSHKELLALAKELDVKVPKALQTSNKKNHKKIVALILDSGEEE